jgi:hypothetical protein
MIVTAVLARKWIADPAGTIALRLPANTLGWGAAEAN